MPSKFNTNVYQWSEGVCISHGGKLKGVRKVYSVTLPCIAKKEHRVGSLTALPLVCCFDSLFLTLVHLLGGLTALPRNRHLF